MSRVPEKKTVIAHETNPAHQNESKKSASKQQKHQTCQNSFNELSSFAKQTAASRHGACCEKESSIPSRDQLQEKASSHLARDGLVGSRRGV